MKNKDAIEMMKRLFFHDCTWMWMNPEAPTAINMAIKALEKTDVGTWIEHTDETGATFECSECHEISGWCYNFCPNCGNDKRGDEE